MVAKEIIGDIIKSQIEESNYSQKEVSLLSGIDEITLSKIINGKTTITSLNSQKLAKVFDDFKDDEDFLIRTYNKIKNLETSNMENTKLLDGIKEFELMSDFSKINIINKNIDGDSLENFEKFILNSSISYSKYKERPKAKLWLILMYKKHKNIKNQNNFKKSTKKTVYKKVFEIFFEPKDNIEERIEKIQKELWNRGIILKNGPFFKSSTMKGVSFVRRNNRFVFLTDMFKREYRWLISLVHELIHFYENIEDEKEIENYAIDLIKNFIKKNNLNHSDFDYFFKMHDDYYDPIKDKYLIDKEKYFKKLKDNTKMRISFGNPNDLISLIEM